MTAAELGFWDYILQLRRNPSQIQDVSFRLEFGGGKYIDLKANGAFIPVTKYNVEQFIDAAVKQQQQVHRYINEIASPPTTTTSSALTTGAAAAAVVAGARSGGPASVTQRGSAVPAPSPWTGGKSAAVVTTRQQQQQPSGGLEGGGVDPAAAGVSTKPRPRASLTEKTATAGSGNAAFESAGWNDTRLRRSDVDSAVVRSMLGLRALYNENHLTAADLAAHNLRFCLPCVEGVYNLIPNGREIKVGLRNFGEFMLRLDEEKWRVEEEDVGDIADAVLPLEEDDAFWTDQNILEIWTYEVTTDLLAKSGLPPEEVVQQTRLQWDTHFLRNSDDPQNVMSGPRGEIVPSQLKNYLKLLHQRLQHIRLAILDARRCGKQLSDVDSNDLGEAKLEAAAMVDAPPPTTTIPVFYPPHQPHPVPPPPTEADLNMLSPTHNTGGLLAPPQSFNI